MDRAPSCELGRAFTRTGNQLMQEAIRLSVEMGAIFPELHKFPDETPLLLSNLFHVEIRATDFEKYIQTLKAQLLNHIDTRR